MEMLWIAGIGGWKIGTPKLATVGVPAGGCRMETSRVKPKRKSFSRDQAKEICSSWITALCELMVGASEPIGQQVAAVGSHIEGIDRSNSGQRVCRWP